MSHAMPSEQLFQALLVTCASVFSVGAVVFLRWFLAPIADANRLAKESDPAQELTFEDPNDTNDKTKHHRFGSLADDATRSLTVILPAYNEQDRIIETIRDTVKYLDERKKTDASFSYEILIVDDCSTDRTVEVVQTEIRTYTVDRIRLLRLMKNHGKGGAVRKGVMRALGERILFADADNATEIRDYAKLESAMNEAKTEGVIVCGSRAHLEEQAIAKRHPLRNLLMHGFHVIVSVLGVKSIRDTQCGFKLFDRAAARLVFAPMHIERWAFDVELLYVAALRSLVVKEVAVQWHEVPGSKLSVVSATLTMLRELILIRLCYTFGIWRVEDGGFRLSRIL